MWNPFRKLADKSTRERPAPNRIDELANGLMRDGRESELEQELAKLDLRSLTPREEQSWWHLWGITAFQAGRDEESLARFEEGHEKFPDSTDISFSLGQQYIRTGDIEKGFELFRGCTYPSIPHSFAFAQARYAYLWNRFDEGREFLRPFFNYYRELGILDDHFLYMRGLPFFGRWWGYFAALSTLGGDFAELEKITNYVIRHCGDYDSEELALQLAAVRDDRPQLLIEALEKKLETVYPMMPQGYTKLWLAVVKARSVQNLEEALELFARLSWEKNDSTKLEDIRTLARAEAAHRFGDISLERKEVTLFLSKQPDLLEPDEALDFFLLRYLERLKPEYWRTRGVNA